MALVDCPDCGKKISDVAPACPSCGRPKVIQINVAAGIQTIEQTGKLFKIAMLLGLGLAW